MTIDELARATKELRRAGKSPTFYWREMTNRFARRRNTVEELSASLRECLAILDDAEKTRGRRAGKVVDFAARSRFAERLAHTPGVIRYTMLIRLTPKGRQNVTDEAEEKPKEGWGWPDNSKKAHYFHEGRSLCMRWMYLGKLTKTQRTSERRGPDDCPACHKRLLKLRPPSLLFGS